jgi:hypothetical protein
MKGMWLSCLAVVLSILAVRVSAETIDDILTLAQKGMGEEVLLATVERSKGSFNLSAADILKLKDAKVPDKVIAAMIRHKGAAGEAAVAMPRELPPALPKEDQPVLKYANDREAPAEGTLNIENVDEKVWSYSYEPEAKTIWISTAVSGGRGNLKANGGVTIRFSAGTYKVRYNGEETGPAVTIFAGEKSSLLLTRVDTAELEALYVTIFERGQRKAGERIAVLRQSAPARTSKKDSAQRYEDEDAPQERIVERERVVEAPTTTIIYRDAYVPPPVMYYPRYYTPSYPYYYYPSRGYLNFGFQGHSGHSGYRSGFSIGIGGRY